MLVAGTLDGCWTLLLVDLIFGSFVSLCCLLYAGCWMLYTWYCLVVRLFTCLLVSCPHIWVSVCMVRLSVCMFVCLYHFCLCILGYLVCQFYGFLWCGSVSCEHTKVLTYHVSFTFWLCTNSSLVWCSNCIVWVRCHTHLSVFVSPCWWFQLLFCQLPFLLCITSVLSSSSSLCQISVGFYCLHFMLILY